MGGHSRENAASSPVRCRNSVRSSDTFGRKAAHRFQNSSAAKPLIEPGFEEHSRSACRELSNILILLQNIQKRRTAAIPVPPIRIVKNSDTRV